MGILGFASALQPAFQQSRKAVPEPLWHYMSAEVDFDEWYPFEDYLGLVRTLGGLMDETKCKGDVYRALGVIAAKRDVQGKHTNVPENQRLQRTGEFRSALAGTTGLATFVRRALMLRERYYSRGYYRVKRLAPGELRITLHDFPPTAELCKISTGYLIELFRGRVPGTWVKRTSCLGEGGSECTWSVQFAAGADVTDLSVFE